MESRDSKMIADGRVQALVGPSLATLLLLSGKLLAKLPLLTHL